jgi:DNA-binding NtrC family response regulator
MTLREYRSQTEQAYLLNLIEEAGGNLRRISRIAGVARVHLYRLVAQHRLEDTVRAARHKARVSR